MAKAPSSPSQLTLPTIEPELQEKIGGAKPARTRAASSDGDAAELGPPNLGQPVRLRVPDFADPNRPKTCLEVDFPIVPINALSALEGNAGKPIYQMSKWWARRRSCVFRAMLIAAAMEAPIRKHPDGTPVLDADGLPVPDINEAAKAVWDVYYTNHQKADNFSHLKVLDSFMGGGTTLVEGSRLGFQVAGVDLNPVAWFVVQNELACTDPAEVRNFFAQIEAEVKPVIQPFYVTECPRGHHGKWLEAVCADNPADDRPMTADFNPLALSPDERKKYRYVGPELIYTFWAKHGPCSKPGCGHRTPIFRSPVIAEKKLGVKYIPLTCKKCKTAFHAELGAARMAPAAERIVLGNEQPFTELSQPFAHRLQEYGEGKKHEKKARAAELYDLVDSEPGLRCPLCSEFSGQYLRDVLNSHRQAATAKAIDKKDLHIEPSRNSVKPVYCYLMIDPDWIQGAPGKVDGKTLGGYSDAEIEDTIAWYTERLKGLRLIEVRGRIKLADDTSVANSAESAEPVEQVPDEVEDEGETQTAADEPDRKEFGLPRFITRTDGRQVDTRRGTIPKQSHFTCGSCGKQQDLRESVEQTGHGAPVAVYAVQGYCPDCDAEGRVYGGRYFAALSELDSGRLSAAEREWRDRCDTDLADYWPREEIPHTYMTHHANFALPKQGYTHWWMMFNSRQLLVHTQLAQFIRRQLLLPESRFAAMQALGAHQQYLRNQCMFAFWHTAKDHFAPHFGNPNYSPKNNVVEVGLWTRGYGSWTSTISSVTDGSIWARNPWEPLILHNAATKSVRAEIGDPVLQGALLLCKSSSELSEFADKSIDLAITDPPFGDNIFYSDLANFFHAWLRLALRGDYPDLFGPTSTPNAQEALAPRLLPEEEANDYYKVRLTACWTEAGRVLKDGGLLAFTFHHSEDSQWAIVLESLFDAGFLLELTFPVASDENKGSVGAKGTEYDIIHVCRKRLVDPTPVSWAKMRQWVKAELHRLRSLLEAYKAREIADADIRVILRGKALEFYSRHYGQVFTATTAAEPEPLSIRFALAGINQLLDEDTTSAEERPPAMVQPLAYQFLRLFAGKTSLGTDAVSKSLFSTTIRQRDFEDRGWVIENGRCVEAVPIRDRFEAARKRPRKEMRTEIDQAHFLIGGAMPGSGVDLEQELGRDTWLVRRTVAAVLDWYAKTAVEPEVREAAKLAGEILRRVHDRLRQEPAVTDRQQLLFGDEEGEEW